MKNNMSRKIFTFCSFNAKCTVSDKIWITNALPFKARRVFVANFRETIIVVVFTKEPGTGKAWFAYAFAIDAISSEIANGSVKLTSVRFFWYTFTIFANWLRIASVTVETIVEIIRANDAVASETFVTNASKNGTDHANNFVTKKYSMSTPCDTKYK